MKKTVDQPVSSELCTTLASPSEAWRRIWRWFVPYVLIALTAIFILPRLVPIAPSASDSYLFGYNNRVGIILLLIFVALGTVLSRGFNLQARTNLVSGILPRWMLPASLCFVAVCCTVMYLIAGRYHGFGESFYIIDRIALLEHGRPPYRDFEFVYGPAQLYVPLFLHHMLPLNLGDAYYLFWALSYLIGTYFLFRSIDDIQFPTPSKAAIFVLLYAAGLFAIIRMGTNYTFLRYVLPLYFVLKLNSRFRDPRVAHIFKDVLVCILFCSTLILLSPETAIAFAFASGCIALFCRSIAFTNRLLISALLFVSQATLFVVAFKFHVLDAMLADGGGAINFPIVPGLTILTYFVALFITACWLYRRVLIRDLDDPTLGLVFFSIPMIAAALGRCDPSHVFWNGLAAFLASLLYISLFRKAWRYYAAAFFLFVFLAPNLTEFYLFVPQLQSAVSLNNHPENRPTEAKIQAFLGTWPGSYVAPFGFRPDGFGTYQSPRIDYGRFEDIINVSMPHSVTEKLSEISTNSERALILPAGPELYCRPGARSERQYLKLLLLSPYIGNIVHMDSPRLEICRYIASHYHPILEPSAETWSYGVWVPLHNH